MKTRMAWLWLLMGLTAPLVRADVWDQGSGNDNGTQTPNELVNGTYQLHDLAALPGAVADEDWYRIGQAPYSSWEIVIDSLSASTPPPFLPLVLQRIASDGSGVLQTSQPISSLGLTRSLRWENTTANPVDGQYIKVKAASCSTNCTVTDTYQVRAYDTTYSIARFNNSTTQVTSLIIQNKSNNLINGTIYFWNGAVDQNGTLITTSALSMSPKTTTVLNLVTIIALQNKAGSITITNSGRFHDLSGKTVGLEPATGFAFDTPMEPRGR